VLSRPIKNETANGINHDLSQASTSCTKSDDFDLGSYIVWVSLAEANGLGTENIHNFHLEHVGGSSDVPNLWIRN
jgi:hypothetical protein